jgi:hypothetical protein
MCFESESERSGRGDAEISSLSGDKVRRARVVDELGPPNLLRCFAVLHSQAGSFISQTGDLAESAVHERLCLGRRLDGLGGCLGCLLGEHGLESLERLVKVLDDVV